MVLVPLRAGGEIIGLLQLNDRRPGMVGPSLVPFLEEIGSSIGIALERKRIEEELRAHRDHLEDLVDRRTATLTRTNEKLVQEIDEHDRAQWSLRASEERFRRYFDLGLIGMAVTSPDKGWVQVNDRLCRDPRILPGGAEAQVLGGVHAPRRSRSGCRPLRARNEW